ncbi:MAG: DNA gyrase subunit A [Atopococcus tabaci]|uniref:DNA gyrase subunit A n=1 Tax=Atopococcus tabaci TaxID=269774 RepID=A0AA43UCL0_9LACT|nr:DNA gyrase subunit A [Atopococcus tabaci]
MVEDYKENITVSDLSGEMKQSFLDYAMSVIVSRALPDVRDGLKPVHRRILYGMQELGNTPDKAYKKSARIVGDVMGKYHPHGDSAIYDAMVRLAQNFSTRYELVDGHGNFGSVDGDSAAAMRYTEARLSKISMEMLRDINKNTIDFRENYDGSENEPVILPARFPNLLVNGTSGIAVGMATNIPPHHLGETIAALKVLMDNPECTTMDLMEALPGPDFPTGATVIGKSGIRKAYETGKGSIIIRAKAEIESLPGDRERIIITELPYMVNKARLVEKIAELARDKAIEGITALRDESDRQGMRIVINVRKDASASVILNNLYKQTQMQTSFGFNMLAIVEGVPRTLSLKEILVEYLKHQQEVIRRRTQFDLDKAEARVHILEGLRIAIDNIDEIIKIIRGSQQTDQAKQELINRFNLSSIQAQAILDMRLARLTGLERDKIEAEYKELLINITDLRDILAQPKRINQIISEELDEISEKYSDERRTKLLAGEIENIDDEDLIDEESVVIVMTKKGYIKRMLADDFRTQNRGGRGVQGIETNVDDYMTTILNCSTHDTILFFTNTGRVYKIKAYEIPEFGRTAKGLPIVNVLNLNDEEKVQAMINFEDTPTGEEQVFFVTERGTVKRTALAEFSNIRNNGIIAINLNEGDSLRQVMFTDGQQNIIIATRLGYSVSFRETDIRSIGRSAAGVRGINLREGDEVIGAAILEEKSDVLIVTSKGYGKRTSASRYPLRNRGGKGIKTVNLTEKNGELVSLLVVEPDDNMMLISSDGITIKFNVANVSKTGRVTQGVRLMRMTDDAFVTAAEIIDRVIEEGEEEIDTDGDEE